MLKIALPLTGLKTNLNDFQIGPITFFRLKKDFIKDISIENDSSLAIAIYSSEEFDFNSKFNIIEFLEDALAIFRLYVCQIVNPLAALNIISKRKLWTYSELYEINCLNPELTKIVGLNPGGRIYEFRLTQEHLNQFNKSKLPELLHLLYKLHRKETIPALDELITKSSTWAGQMLEDTYYRDRFLRGVTALETIVEKSHLKGISRKFRELGSKLYFKFDKYYTIESLENSLKEIYKLRCNISHAGDMNFGISQSLFDELISTICFNAIQVWIDVNSIEEFYQEIDNCMHP